MQRANASASSEVSHLHKAMREEFLCANHAPASAVAFPYSLSVLIGGLAMRR